MKFGSFSLDDAVGLTLAHAIRLPERRLAKGSVLSSADIADMAAQGIASVIAVRLDADDLPEDEAATRIAAVLDTTRLRLSDASTGRVNVYAMESGLFFADRHVVDSMNRIDPAITIACLADRAAVQAGDMVATIKIIPLAVPLAKVEAAAASLAERPPFWLKPFRPRQVILIATQLPTLKSSVMDKTAKILDRRLEKYGSRITKELRVGHDVESIRQAIRGLKQAPDGEPAMVVIFGASAVADADDVLPAGIRAAGGVVDHIGMPVDPGNLLVLGRLGDVPVIGAPGCARSPKENGFDWILHRIMADDVPTPADIAGLGVGGLLMEIASRPQPREADARGDGPVTVAAVLLAAGQARRMRADEAGRTEPSWPHKLLAEFDGKPLVRRSAEMLLSADLASIVAVTGHRRIEVEAALSGLDLCLEYNSDYADGMASSLVHGFRRREAAIADGVLVMLADMPAVTVRDVNRLIAAFREAGGEAVIRSVHGGKRGNPIILPREVYAAVLRLEGDIGARAIIENSGLPVIDIDIGPAAHIDVDTQESVISAGGVLKA